MVVVTHNPNNSNDKIEFQENEIESVLEDYLESLSDDPEKLSVGMQINAIVKEYESKKEIPESLLQFVSKKYKDNDKKDQVITQVMRHSSFETKLTQHLMN